MRLWTEWKSHVLCGEAEWGAAGALDAVGAGKLARSALVLGVGSISTQRRGATADEGWRGGAQCEKWGKCQIQVLC